MLITLRMLFVLIALLDSIEGRKSKPVIVRFLAVSAIPNPDFFKYCNVSITPGSNGRSFDLQANLLTNITRDFYVGLVFLMKNKKENDYKEFFSYDFDACRLMDGFMSQTVARLWAQNLKKFSNFQIKCPVRQGNYFIKKMSINKSSIPMVAITGIYMVKVLMYIKRASSRPLTVINASVEGEVNF